MFVLALVYAKAVGHVIVWGHRKKRRFSHSSLCLRIYILIKYGGWWRINTRNSTYKAKITVVQVILTAQNK